jgi:CubicO group peptidase (beta-lactamase class C family)
MNADRLRRAATSVTALLFALLCLLVSTPLAEAAAQPSRYAAIDAYVRHQMKATNAPGLAYAVVGPGGPIHQRSWGTDGRGDRVTAQTPFLWGSVAKPVTATAVMTLVQSGRLRLDDRVVDYLPDLRFGGTAHDSKITIRHLLGHTSGLPSSATSKVTDCFGSGCPRPAGRLRALNDVKPLGAPGTRYAYTSANYLILAAVVESVTRQPFTDYLRAAVLDPAGMDGAITDAASTDRHHLSPGHQLLWGRPSATADGVDDHGAAYGYLGGDLGDLAAFASLQLRSGKTASGRTLLTTESVRLMRQQGRLQPTGEATDYGLGWRVGGLDAPLDRAIWHTGATPGYSSMLFLLPERDIALVLQQNLYGILNDGAVMQVGFGAAQLLAGGHPPGDSSTSGYYLTVWGATASALALMVAAGRSALLLRRPAVLASRRRRITLATAWSLAGALPLIAFALLVSRTGLRPLMTWLPDAFIAVCVAATAGAVTITLRLILARRTTHTHRRSSTTTRYDDVSSSPT